MVVKGIVLTVEESLGKHGVLYVGPKVASLLPSPGQYVRVYGDRGDMHSAKIITGSRIGRLRDWVSIYRPRSDEHVMLSFREGTDLGLSILCRSEPSNLADALLEGLALEMPPFRWATFEEALKEGEFFPLESYLNSETDVLGTYYPMTSPGRIVLHKNELWGFYLRAQEGLISKLPIRLAAAQQSALYKIVVLKTLTHEFFHHFCDIQNRFLFHQSPRGPISVLGPSSNPEEALAVAHSYHNVGRSRQARFLSHEVWFGEFLSIIYSYTQPRYRDWRLFEQLSDFKEGVLNYINPARWHELRQNGVAIRDMLFSQIGEAYHSQVDIQVA